MQIVGYLSANSQKATNSDSQHVSSSEEAHAVVRHKTMPQTSTSPNEKELTRSHSLGARRPRRTKSLHKEQNYMRRFLDKDSPLADEEESIFSTHNDPCFLVKLKVSATLGHKIQEILQSNSNVETSVLADSEGSIIDEDSLMNSTKNGDLALGRPSSTKLQPVHPFSFSTNSSASNSSQNVTYHPFFTSSAKRKHTDDVEDEAKFLKSYLESGKVTKLKDPLWPGPDNQTEFYPPVHVSDTKLPFSKRSDSNGSALLTLPSYSDIFSSALKDIDSTIIEPPKPEIIQTTMEKLHCFASESLGFTPLPFVENVLSHINSKELVNNDYNLSNTLWTMKYSPKKSLDSCASSDCISKIEDWLRSCKLSKPAAPSHTPEKSSVISRSSTSQSRTSEKSSNDSLSESEYEPDIITDDEDNYIANSRKKSKRTVSQCPNWMVVVGPNGIGKTASIYAICHELNFRIVEIHPGMRRSGRELLERIGELTQSHVVGGSKEKESTNTLILLEEVDIIFQEDRGFWQAVTALIEKSKRPVAMTCNQTDFLPSSFLQEDHIVEFQQLPLAALTDYLSSILFSERAIVSRSVVESLIQKMGPDLRTMLMQLNFWCLTETMNPLGSGNDVKPQDIPTVEASVSAFNDGINIFNDRIQSEESLLQTYSDEQNGDLGILFLPNTVNWRKPPRSSNNHESFLDQLNQSYEYTDSLSHIDACFSNQSSIYETYDLLYDSVSFNDIDQDARDKVKLSCSDHLMGFPIITDPFKSNASPEPHEVQLKYPLFNFVLGLYEKKDSPIITILPTPLKRVPLYLAVLASKVSYKTDPDEVYNALSFFSLSESHSSIFFPPNSIDRTNDILITEVAPYIRAMARFDRLRLNAFNLLLSSKGRSASHLSGGLNMRLLKNLGFTNEKLQYLGVDGGRILSTWLSSESS
ncbi:DNA replication factor C complex subunit Elg1 [Schizosaccharomyces cryophilus OY26]|uniref:DNA replication factor C complex subunit Elg1 n=1 Tax=Schizosaccharomyces cryophilus (strain OY26 / ATCC MYA-4695 / CBS 11777 / NBRC 106824 / NRRL Y48691) TaxID=653667 RepID=S9VTQ6_SCHCR|nr:DNA replication factor C complex subunit Elg1 [Schizosaccharomyces cryophilus OY26]EPY49440.1 DNA replication factor C complex subunit Elg1 [Schizosaccharomyces cryophilus OY26]